jgi:hypothetical protein
VGQLGHVDESDALYRESIALVDVMIEHAATINIQRYFPAEMSDVYVKYCASLCRQKRYEEALGAIEKVRGRVESEALEHHASQPLHPATPEERELMHINIALVNTDDHAA